MVQTLVFLDIETTGLNPDIDDIIEVAALKIEEGIETGRFSSLVRTFKKLSSRIISLTGITNEMLIAAPPQEEVLTSLIDFIGSDIIIGHNISFDVSFIEKKIGYPLNNQVFDTMELMQILKPCAKSYRLDRTPETLGITVEESHRAMSDVEAAVKVYFCCMDFLNNLDREILAKFYDLCVGRGWNFARAIVMKIEKSLLTFPGQKTDLPYAYLSSSYFEEDSLFSGLSKSNSGEELSGGLDSSNLGDLLGENGPFAQNTEQYSFRQGQHEMLEAVVEGFKNDKHIIVEAGTGTGKSLAYLIPSVFWALENDSKVVIATHTINLQEQLWNKEIPYLKQVTGWDFQCALVKGKNNYLCLRRWEEKLADGSEDQEEVKFILKILTWLTETITGDKSEINLNSSQQQFWQEISSDINSCLGSSCPWFHKYCFVIKARKYAENSQILIVNHSLLLADIKTDNRVLPSFDYLVIDEAHHLEESATEQLGWTIGLNYLKAFFLGLNRGFGGSLVPGLFNQLKQVIRNHSDVFAEDIEKLDNLINESFNIVKDIHISVDETDAFLQSWMNKKSNSEKEESSLSVRICDNHRNNKDWDDLSSICDNYISRSTSLAKTLNKLSAYFESLDRETQKKFWKYMKEIDSVLNNLAEINNNLRLFLSGSDGDVYWIENVKGLKADVKIRCAPITVSNLLHDNLFSTKKSVLLTSATISVEGDFSHFMERTGLSLFDDSKLIKKSLKSPFNYESQSLLCIVRNLPDPASELESEYIDHIVPVIKSVVDLFQGRTLVLFTSHKMLTETYIKLYPFLDEQGITLLGHKIDGGRSRLVNEFKTNKHSVLLGANSFWEGIDLPGDILKCVIIARLPFSSPNTPVNEARIEELIDMNVDPFQRYTLPQAVIKFKQGFGRLIRTENDDGVVLVLDRRIIEKSYGRVFLNSLPVNTHFRGDTNGVLQKISEWVDGERNSMYSLNIIESISDIEKYIKKAVKKGKLKNNFK